MSTETAVPTFRMSGTAFRTLPPNCWVRESCPADYHGSLYGYVQLFNDPAIGELVWRLTEAGKNNSGGRCWQGLHFDEMIAAMRVEPLDPLRHNRRSDYAAFGIMRSSTFAWPHLMEGAKRRLTAASDLLVYADHYIYPAAPLLAKLEPLRTT